MNYNKKKIGSAVLAVIVYISVLYIYIGTLSNQTALAGYIQADTEKKIKDVYEKDISNLDNVYVSVSSNQ